MILSRQLSIAALALALVASAATLGSLHCNKIRKATGISESIETPDPESPEWVVQQCLIAAMDPSEKSGWQSFRKMLHSDQLASLHSEKNWRQFNFKYLRVRIKLFLPDDTKPYYELAYTQDIDDGNRKIFIVNEKSDVPTPFKLKRDPKAGNNWRLNFI